MRWPDWLVLGAIVAFLLCLLGVLMWYAFLAPVEPRLVVQLVLRQDLTDSPTSVTMSATTDLFAADATVATPTPSVSEG